MAGWREARWSQMTSGEACPMCADAYLERNEHGVLVRELRESYARLPFNQYMRGWTVVILKGHRTELFDMTPTEFQGFWSDVRDVAAAVHEVFEPVKVNYCVYGNLVPHLHCHVLPRYAHEDPEEPVDMRAGHVRLPDEEHDRLARELATGLGASTGLPER